jgi:hydrogenase maturation factor
VTIAGHTSACITCGDDAIVLTVLRIDEQLRLAHCSTEFGETQSVEIDLVSPVRPGDSLLVHAGTALQVMRRR